MPNGVEEVSAKGPKKERNQNKKQTGRRRVHPV
jgi:hypothetical protein